MLWILFEPITLSSEESDEVTISTTSLVQSFLYHLTDVKITLIKILANIRLLLPM